MALKGLPTDATTIGTIEIVRYLKADGEGIAYDVDGFPTEFAIGALTAVLDRLREERRLDWDTCPDCGAPWSEHFEDEEAE